MKKAQGLSGSTSKSVLSSSQVQTQTQAMGNESVEDETSPKQFKGVSRNKNGKWGVQIYSRNKRTWLGTFDSKEEALLAYDRASMKLLGKDGHRNSPGELLLERESYFQDLYTDEQVVEMIKDHSYDEKLEQILHPHRSTERSSGLIIGSSVMHKHLFKKELTVSDVGSLNRLVVPKKHAKAHFPELKLESEDGICLTFTDSDSKEKEWQCTFKYWKSCQSYVLTNGWLGFVKDKNLEAGDTVSFSTHSTMADCTFYITARPRPRLLNCMPLLTRTASLPELLDAQNPHKVQAEGIMHGPDINILPDDEGGIYSGTDLFLAPSPTHSCNLFLGLGFVDRVAK